MASERKFICRRAKIDDIKVVREMIQELADFEKMGDGPQLTEEDLIRDSGLRGDKELCHIYVLELQTNESAALSPIGYAICFFNYSTWQGKTYFLEDLYVRPAYRRTGAGTFLYRSIAGNAKEFGCKRVDLHVLAWNPARKFYEKMGAIDLTKKEEWLFYRLHEEEIQKLAKDL